MFHQRRWHQLQIYLAGIIASNAGHFLQLANSSVTNSLAPLRKTTGVRSNIRRRRERHDVKPYIVSSFDGEEIEADYNGEKVRPNFQRLLLQIVVVTAAALLL